jgi:hypothetical protein
LLFEMPLLYGTDIGFLPRYNLLLVELEAVALVDSIEAIGYFVACWVPLAPAGRALWTAAVSHVHNTDSTGLVNPGCFINIPVAATGWQ